MPASSNLAATKSQRVISIGVSPAALFLGDENGPARLVFLSRIVVFVLVVLSIVLAFLAADWIFWLVLFAWGGLGASLGPTIILSLFWKKTTKWGVLAGLISGTVVTILWKSHPVLKGALYELIPAFTVSFLLTILVSFFTATRE